MGSATSYPDNVAVTHESGCSRACNSIFLAVCLAPAALVGSAVLLGWNEQRAVCDSKAIVAGRDKVQEVGCYPSNPVADGALVMFSCDFAKYLLPAFSPGGDFAGTSYIGTGLQVDSDMLQCVESKATATTKDMVGGGTTTITTYYYSLEWRSSRVDSSTFAKKDSTEWRTNCGAENPQWPAGLPKSGSNYAKSLQVGSYTVGEDYVRSIPLDAPVLAVSPPAGWSQSGNVYESKKYQATPNGIGWARTAFKGTDWSNTMVTVLGAHSASAVGRWTAPSSWLCSGFSLGTLRTGRITKEDLFANLVAEASSMTWFVRFAGFLMAWVAFWCCFMPLQVAGDCVPCIGPCLGDSISAMTVCVSFIPACACTIGIIGVVWIVMRPAVGVPLVVAFVVIIAGFAASVLYSRHQKAKLEVPMGEPVVMGRYVVSEDQAPI